MSLHLEKIKGDKHAFRLFTYKEREVGKTVKMVTALDSNFRSQFGKQFAFAKVAVFDTLIRFVS